MHELTKLLWTARDEAAFVALHLYEDKNDGLTIAASDADLDGDLWYSLNRDEVRSLRDSLQAWLNKCPTCEQLKGEKNER